MLDTSGASGSDCQSMAPELVASALPLCPLRRFTVDGETLFSRAKKHHSIYRPAIFA